ncbi:MAG: acetyl-CoA acetyltransferase [Sciscionella sp.]
MDPRTAVLVGAAQRSVTDTAAAVSPLGLMAEVSRTAAADTATEPGRLLDALDSITVINCLTWPVPDPAAALALRLGSSPVSTGYTHTSGTSPIEALAEGCERISDGAADCVLIAGAETVRAYQDGRFTGGEQPTDPATGAGSPMRMLGSDRTASHPAELAAGLTQPVQYYPLFENAVRAANGSDIATHEAALGDLWSRFAAVARRNPHAWVRSGPDPAEILTVSEGNRMICSPYRKLLTANVSVDQGAALVLCSAQRAAELGIPRERWVFPHAIAHANDHWLVGNRADLHRSPAINAIGAALSATLDRGVADIEHIDLYSCFPCAVQIAATELGLPSTDPARALTVTGGLTFAGGPVSNYVTHALATLIPLLRANPQQFGLSTAVGWYLTKHAAAVLSAQPPRMPARGVSAQQAVDRLPMVEIAEDAEGTAIVETYTAGYGRSSRADTVYLVLRLADGRRTFRAVTAAQEQRTVDRLLSTDPIGCKIELSADDGIRVNT